MDQNPSNNVTDPNLNSSEHMEENIIAKRTALYGWYPASLAWNRVQTDQNGVLQSNVVVNASIAVTGGVTTVFQGGAPWLIAGNVTIFGNITANVAVSQVFQGGAPWLVNSSIVGVPNVSATIGVPTVNQGTNPWLTNASIVGNVPVTATIATLSVGNVLNALVSVSNFPSATATTTVANFPAIQNVIASVANFPTTQNVIATIANSSIPVTESGAWNVTATIGNIPAVSQSGAPWTANVSLQGTPNIQVASIVTLAIGSMPNIAVSVSQVFQGGAPWLVNASVIGQIPVTASIVGNIPVTATIATLSVGNLLNTLSTVTQGTSPWLTNSSIVGTLGVNASIQGTPSINIATIVTLAIGSMPNIAVSVSQVFQGGAPWTVNASIQGIPSVNASIIGVPGVIATVLQGTSPWLVNASVVGQQNVTASIAGVPNVLATVFPLGVYNSVLFSLVSLQTQQLQLDSAANLLSKIATITNPIPITQSTNPWLVNASVVGILNVNATVPGIANVNASIIGIPGIIATVLQGTSPWLVNASIIGQQAVTASVVGQLNASASIIGIINALSTVTQGTNPWLVNASIIGLSNVNATYSAPWQVVASQVANLPQVMASMANPAILTGAVEFSQYSPSIVSIISAATFAYYPNVTDINAQDLTTHGASASAIGATPIRIASLVATVVTIKGTGTTNLYGYHIYNSNSSAVYIGLYAQTIATAGLTVPTAQLVVPAGGWADTAPSTPISFNSGLMVNASASINGSGNPTNSILFNAWYK